MVKTLLGRETEGNQTDEREQLFSHVAGLRDEHVQTWEHLILQQSLLFPRGQHTPLPPHLSPEAN